MKKYVVDFESYYDADLSVSNIGLPNYVAQTDAYLVSVIADDLEFCGSPVELVTSLGDSWINDPSHQFWAANSNFDQALWEKYFPKTAHDWECILDVASVSQLPRNLAGVSKTILGKALDKSVRDKMKGVRYETLPEAEQQEVFDYCHEDTKTTWELVHKLKEPTSIEKAIAAHTRLCNRRGVRIDVEAVERDLEYLERIRFDAMKRIPWVQEADAPPLSYQQFSNYCRIRGVEPPASIDKRDDACKDWVNKNPELGKAVMAMRNFRGANTKLEKVRSLQARLTPDGILPLELRYCGAPHTRRWSSAGFNVQNLDKEAAFADIMAEWPEFKNSGTAPKGIFMRNYLIPRPGYKFGVLDFAQIEPRCLNWLAGNEEMLAAMRAGFGVYEAYARSIKIWTSDVPMKKGDPALYHQTKGQVLGLGFGMGTDKYADIMKLPREEADRQVKEWRKHNRKIVQLWGSLDKLISSACLSSDSNLEIEMPTGDVLRHFYVKRKGKGYESYTTRGDFSATSRQPSLWGGTLTENITQRMARDIMAESVVRLEKAGFPVIFHAHDEVIIEVPADSADSALKDAEHLMKTPPEWCFDLPLGVEGDVCDRYTKL